MNDNVIVPASVEELVSIVVEKKSLLPIGNRTKPPLSRCSEATLVSLRGLTGIIDYQPSEFTFTARAGTPVAEVVSILAGEGQYLPFDPLLVDSGATIGGTVAAGLSGPGRFRFGGIRDFVLGTDFVSGDGQVIRAGGKVVKNAAGFDIPKFLVGSMGRLGVLTELTFKVFPKPVATRTLRVQCESHSQAIERTMAAASSFWELEAVDYRPDQQSMYLRLAGPASGNDSIAKHVATAWGADVSEMSQSDEFWRSIRELNWIPDAAIAAKIPITAKQFVALSDLIDGDCSGMQLSVAGNVAWILLDSSSRLAAIDSAIEPLGIKGLVVRGDTDRPCIGRWPQDEIESAIKAAMDPPGRFPAFAAGMRGSKMWGSKMRGSKMRGSKR